MCRGDVVANEHLLLVRANMDPHREHPFHTHPTREEIIYVISGRAEQWVGREKRLLKAGEMRSSRWARCTGRTIPSTSRWCFWRFFRPLMRRSPGLSMFLRRPLGRPFVRK